MVLTCRYLWISNNFISMTLYKFSLIKYSIKNKFLASFITLLALFLMLFNRYVYLYVKLV